VVALDPVSVVIPTFNRAPLVPRALGSALAAMGPDDELIVVDDGSTDATPEVLAGYGERIRVLRTRNGGAGRARNLGVASATRPLVAFLDSDDEWTPDRLRLGRQLLAARPDVLFCISNFGLRRQGRPEEHDGLAGWHRGQHDVWEEILGPGIPYSSFAPLPEGRPDFAVHTGDLYPPLLDKGYVAVQTLLVRRVAAAGALRFPEDLPTFEDWECSARLARAGRAAVMDCETAWQWGHGGPRLTDAPELVALAARLTMIDRLWAADAEFLARHPGRVEHRLHDLRLARARCLLRAGRTREARRDLRQAGRPRRLVDSLLAALPGPLTRALLSVWAMLAHSG
jgi:glycosyltransferase involved in cell wall biosynthesis